MFTICAISAGHPLETDNVGAVVSVSHTSPMCLYINDALTLTVTKDSKKT